MDECDPPGLQVRSDAANHGNLAGRGGGGDKGEKASVRRRTKKDIKKTAWVSRRTAPDNNLKPSVRSKPLVEKNVRRADSPETTTTVCWQPARRVVNMSTGAAIPQNRQSITHSEKMKLEDRLPRLIECPVEKVEALAEERVDGEYGEAREGGRGVVFVLVVLEQGRGRAEDDDKGDEGNHELDSKAGGEKRLCGGPETDGVRHLCKATGCAEPVRERKRKKI